MSMVGNNEPDYSQQNAAAENLKNIFTNTSFVYDKLIVSSYDGCSVKPHFFLGIPFHSVSFRIGQRTFPRPTEFRGIMISILSLFPGSFAKQNFDGNPNQYAGARWLVALMKGKRKGHVGITLPGSLAVESVKKYIFTRCQPEYKRKEHLSPFSQNIWLFPNLPHFSLDPTFNHAENSNYNSS